MRHSVKSARPRRGAPGEVVRELGATIGRAKLDLLVFSPQSNPRPPQIKSITRAPRAVARQVKAYTVSPERRIEELERQVMALSRQVKELQSQQTMASTPGKEQSWGILTSLLGQGSTMSEEEIFEYLSPKNIQIALTPRSDE